MPTYHDLRIGDRIPETDIELVTAGDRVVSLRWQGTVHEVLLARFRLRTLGNPEGGVPSVVESGDWRIGVDLTQPYMSGTAYSRSHVNLAPGADARVSRSRSGEAFSGPGDYRFPVADYTWHGGENWLPKVIYGWHLGVDLDGPVGQPLVACTAGRILAVRHGKPGVEDYWGNGLALLGDDGRVYIYFHWKGLADGIATGVRVEAGDPLGTMGRSGYESKSGIDTHLHFEVLEMKDPEAFRFAFQMEPEVLPTPNRFLPPECGGYVVNPYPYLMEWAGKGMMNGG